MDNDFTVTAAFVTAFAAIIAPTITALIHSIKEYKISKMNHTIEERLKLCKLFSETYSKCQYGSHKTGYMSLFYNQALSLAAVCSHRSVRRHIFALANEVHQHGASVSTDKLYERCVSLLSKEF
ncbi:hypothetical protein HQK08_07830 [Blautia massiliensis]|uniref:hypothetical protein n=1 Tax=Blautia massiliensis (ex Durand et al. 2017) TaxID=1737424 RepID=UPI00156DDE4A|nr:hypothetical protein [Blautia massiliensis (ex Durand et al. 2017)]NSK79821.1 hypothetical protein [Blautia massiliensis (ex Durand et al. 2017)]